MSDPTNPSEVLHPNDARLHTAEYAETKAILLKAVRAYNCRTFTGHVVIDFEVRAPYPQEALERWIEDLLPVSPEGTMDYGVRSWSVVDA